MAWEEYDYTPRWHRVSKRDIYRPIVDIDVSFGKKTETIMALIDSGTEVTIMNTEIAQLLEISPNGKGEARIFAFGDIKQSEKVGFLQKVNIVVPEFPDEVLTTTVAFIDSFGKGAPYDVLLGQDDFFRRFLVRFEKHKNKFYLDVA